MGFHLQINPTSEARQISRELAYLLDEHVADFDIRYCYVRETSRRRLTAQLEQFTAVGDDERDAIAELLRVLADNDPVELMYSC